MNEQYAEKDRGDCATCAAACQTSCALKGDAAQVCAHDPHDCQRLLTPPAKGGAR